MTGMETKRARDKCIANALVCQLCWTFLLSELTERTAAAMASAKSRSIPARNVAEAGFGRIWEKWPDFSRSRNPVQP